MADLKVSMDVRGVPEVRAELDRLRALIKKAELGTENYCPWCNARAVTHDHPADTVTHFETCPAFTVEGEVR